MTERFPLDAAERTALRGRPPKDEAGRRIPWTLADRLVGDEEWEDEGFEQEGLTVERVAFERLEWKANGVFRRCVFRGVSFTECELSGCGFEDVVFEGCTLADLALLRCSFVRCRFVDGSIAGLSAVHSQFTECSWASLEAPGWTLDDCELIRCTFEDTRLSVLHASQCLLGCTITRGTLTSADITECKGDLLAIVGAEARGVRGLGLDLGKLALTGLARGQIALGQCTIGELVLSGCGDLTTFSLVGCKLRLFDVQSCPSLQSVTVRATQLDAMRIAGTSLADTTFEDVTAAGPSLVERSALAGVFFKGGVWTKLALRDVELSGYLAVAGTRFVSLIKDAYREEGAIRRRLEDDQYGPGSMTWRAPDGS